VGVFAPTAECPHITTLASSCRPFVEDEKESGWVRSVERASTRREHAVAWSRIAADALSCKGPGSLGASKDAPLLLEEGSRCWRTGMADRAAVLIDVQDYYQAALEAMAGARRSIHFLNWAFEGHTRFQPGPDRRTDRSEGIGQFLIELANARPSLDVRILCWQSALPVAATQKFFPIVDRSLFSGTRVKFVLDGRLPLGACHHQKMIVIDDEVAFCGGADVGQDRWDTCDHLDDDPRRRTRRGRAYQNRHEVMALVEGEPARSLGALFRERWRLCTGEKLARPERAHTGGGSRVWPADVEPVFGRIRFGVSRTEPGWRGDTPVWECEALHLAGIAAARRCIYMENQYFTSELVGRALACRLREEDGPEVILISGGRSPSYFDRITMDPTRAIFIERLHAADRYGRFRIYSPVTARGREIIVHSKLTIIDDELLRIGSANMDNRSFGFDTECDLSLEAGAPDFRHSRAAIGGVRTGLLAHWLGCAPHALREAIEREGGIGPAIEALRRAHSCRLRPIVPKPRSPFSSLIAAFHIGDPMSPWDSFRPWRRRRALAGRLRAWPDESRPREAGDPRPFAPADRAAS
jgi:phosphatidylserine/phosphatidylglycerophosphate/cardiolipin synthase-like enzyme